MSSSEEMEALGMTRIQAFRYAVFSQVLPSYLSQSLFCFEGNVRYAAILGYVGAGGVGLLINEGLGWRDYPSVGMIIFALVITVFIIERISEHFRKKLSERSLPYVYIRKTIKTSTTPYRIYLYDYIYRYCIVCLVCHIYYI